MEALILVQLNLHQNIKKGLTNFRKSPKERITKEYIEIRTENLDSDWSQFRDNHIKLISLGSAELNQSVYEKDQLFDTTEELYVDYKSLLRKTLNKMSNQTLERNVGKASGSCAPTSSNVRLPKVSIPTFSGKYHEWTSFHDLFTSLIDKNSELADVQKLHYLKGHLTGEAEQLVRHMPITEANYKLCWDQLVNRYNNKRYLANNILKRFFGQKRMYTESSSSLKELLDTTMECLNALKNLDVDVSSWDLIIIHIVTFKLDQETRKQWELSVSNNDPSQLPTIAHFKTFIEGRFRALECIEPKRLPSGSPSSNNQPKVLLATNESKPFVIRCEYCSGQHKLCFCKKFIDQSSDQRQQFVSRNNICFNCLGGNHRTKQCLKATNCRICKRRHHTLLHQKANASSGQQGQEDKLCSSAVTPRTTADDSHVVACLSTRKLVQSRQVLLATALIKTQSRSGDTQVVRALLDQGSQASFVTEATVQLLRLKKSSVRSTVSGLGAENPMVSKNKVTLIIKSLIDPTFSMQTEAYVLRNITNYLPEKRVGSLDWVELMNLKLADPEFDRPNKIDVLLGAEVYGQILKDGVKRAPTGNLVAQCTTLGWILSGTIVDVSTSDDQPSKISVMHAHISEDDILKRFWEIEEHTSSTKIFTEEEHRCEKYFAETTTRTKDGRYVVKLPFRDPVPLCIGDSSREIAERRFKALERKLMKNEDLKKRYTEVIKEYKELDHMRPVRKEEVEKESVYLPHHAVIREDKATTKVRVVFDASCKNQKGVSLNDTLMIGPTLQPDLRHVIIRWRTFPIGLIADIVKMYRQVRITDEEVHFQRLLWRENPKDELQEYELVTVTFGTASAPYLAVKALNQVAVDEGKEYPVAADKVSNSFYMDDLMTGCFTVKEGEILYTQMKELLKKGGFQLQKWNSNKKELLKLIEDSEKESTTKDKDSTTKDKYNTTKDKDSTTKDKDNTTKDKDNTTKDKDNIIKDKQNTLKETGCTTRENYNSTREKDNNTREKEIKTDTTKILGLTWNHHDDIFKYSVHLPSTLGPVTKRSIISDIARLFDPLGWLAPSVILAKTFIQKLWLAGIGWDDEVPSTLVQEWQTYRRELCQLTKVRIPRWLGMKQDDCVVELHGFSDASKVAYAAVVYVRTVDRAGEVHVSLLSARTKVAPIKQISIPRLELCGALLLARVLCEVAEVMHIEKGKVRAWTDSTVVLAWLNSHPSKWKTFVANRVSEILTTLDASQWAHVSTKYNPADCASRGILPSLLADNQAWFSGPQFLHERHIKYTKPKDLDVNLEQAVTVHTVTTEIDHFPWERFSSLNRLLRVVAYCIRFIYSKKENNSKKGKDYIQKGEIDRALSTCIRQSQRSELKEEYEELRKEKPIRIKSSKIKYLNPYLDSEGLIRVGGRLSLSPLEEQKKHPIILPHSSHITKLIVAEAHDKTLHGGPQLMTNYLRSAYWIVGMKSLIKQHIRKCVICVKNKASVRTQLMGSLPSVRCTPARAFRNSGVDYAGPINLRTTKGRGHRSHKGYICVFICMATRAIHLEVVSDMSTAGFLAAFRRFVARRGHCAQIWSDNGTNFVGASRELKELTAIQQSAAEHLEPNGTEWHFIPPHAPNFGGLWEAAVKSTKFHLKRVIGESTLTYEELSTLLSQIEACLNSRPMTIIPGNSPDESMPLTPAHFLVGEPLVAVPDSNYECSSVSSLTRWQLTQRMLQNFWRRWSQEYLTTLLQRYKWCFRNPEPNIGDIVLIKEDNLPPTRWLLGQVVIKHPGHDHITRVVTLRTKNNNYLKRPVSKLCVLPVEH